MRGIARDLTVNRKLLSVPEVAHLIGRSETATRRAIECGQIPARKWGHRLVVLADELDEFLRSLPARKPAQ